MATPISEIQILNVPFNFTQQNVFYFDSLAQQTNYFSGLVKKTIPQNVVVKDNSVDIALRFDEVDGIGNYIRYKNKDKWYYGFIQSVKYVGENVTTINFGIDAWQTYFFDFNVNKSFVEREHVSNDSIGSNTISEPFNYPKIAITSGEVMGGAIGFVLAVTFTADAFDEQINDDIRAGIVTRVVSHSRGRATGGVTKLYTISNAGMNKLKEDINNLADKGTNTITSMLEVPSNFLTSGTPPEYLGVDVNSIGALGYTKQADSLSQLQSKLGYTVRNKKLLGDQFFHWELTNNAGGVLETYPTETNYAAPDYHTTFSLGQNIIGVTRVENLLVGRTIVHLTTAELNSVSWVGNVYAEYMARNENSLKYQSAKNVVSTVAGVVSSIADGNFLGGVGSVVGGIDNALSKVANERDIQNQFSGQRGSQSASGLGVIHAQKNIWWGYGLNKHDLERADLFLDRYGYQVNIFKVPNHTSRTNYNYIKTSECNIVGAIPSEHLAQIINMYNSGFTIWHGQTMSRTLNRNTRNSISDEYVDVVEFNGYMDYSINEIRKDDN